MLRVKQMICIAELMERCEKLQPFTAIDNDLACEFVAMIEQGQGIECVYEMLGLSPVKAKKLIRRSEIMMRCPLIYAICATYKIKMRKTPIRKARLVFLENKIVGTFFEAKEFLVMCESYRWLRRSYANAKYSGLNNMKGVIYIKYKRVAVVETIKPLVFMISIYEVV